jgi:hypothetical protein
VGFGSLVAEATGATATEEAAGTTGLKDLILARYGRKEDKPPPSLDTFYYRASGLAYICPRQEVLQAKYGVFTRVRKPVEEIANYDVGTGMHFAMQNIILPTVGVMRGAWKCLGCARVYGEQIEGKPVYEVAIPRPEVCQCGSKEFLYREYFLQDRTIGTGGHMDGLIVLPRYPGMGLFELKSISQNGAKKVRDVPQIEHVIQANAYMFMSGLQWAKILYWVKGVYAADKNMIEHHLERDESVWGETKQVLHSIRRGMETGCLPNRSCAHRACTRAQECPVLTQCFGDPEVDSAVGLI